MSGLEKGSAMGHVENSHPTPTQEECDKLKMGEHIEKLEADGSDEEPQQAAFKAHAERKSMQAKQPTSSGGYQTRAARAAPTTHGGSHTS